MPSLVSPVRILETFRRITPSVNVWQPHCSQTIGFVFDKISVNSILFVFTFQRYYYFFEVPKKIIRFFLFFYSPEGELVNYSIMNFIFSSAMRVSPFSNITSNKDVSPICLPTSKAHLGSPPLVWM